MSANMILDIISLKEKNIIQKKDYSKNNFPSKSLSSLIFSAPKRNSIKNSQTKYELSKNEKDSKKSPT